MNSPQNILVVLFLMTYGTALSQLETFSVINPLEITPALSGNYGELRPNHFHAGIDLKTAGVVNLPVHVVEEGHVSRIKVSPYGYGKVVYVDHPQGYTTVYAHLNRFNSEIDAFVRQEQYRLHSFAVDVYPGQSDLPLKKEDIVAYTGNTGGSGGPHLHFEVRETKSEIPRNPLLFNFPLSDTKPPVIEAVGLNDIGTGKHIRYRSSALRAHRTISTSGELGIEVSGYDSQDGSTNRNGIFKIQCFVDGVLQSEFVADSIAFDKSRQLNALIDYDHYYRTHQRFIRMYRLPGNYLTNLKCNHGDGMIKLEDGNHEIEIIAFDVAGNRSSLAFNVIVNESPKPKSPPENTIDCSAYYFYESSTSRVTLKPYALYQDVELKMVDDGQKFEFLSPFIPVNYPAEIQLKRDFQDGEVLARFTRDGRPIHALSTTRSGDWLIGTSKSFGIFDVTIDLQPPSIKPINFVNHRVYSNGMLTFSISDNFSGIESFDANINGNWVLTEYEPKKNQLSIDLSEIEYMESEQHLKIEVVDMAGNVGTFEGAFFKK